LITIRPASPLNPGALPVPKTVGPAVSCDVPGLDGPLNTTQVFATYAFSVGIFSGDLPLGASVSLFMLPILAVAATFILGGVIKRGSEV
jgi:hypothetical protein